MIRDNFGHLPGPGKFRITVSMELNSLDSNRLVAAHQTWSDSILLVNENDPGQFWPLFDHLPSPGKFRITVPIELNSLDSNHLIAAHQTRLDLVHLVNGHNQG